MSIFEAALYWATAAITLGFIALIFIGFSALRVARVLNGGLCAYVLAVLTSTVVSTLTPVYFMFGVGFLFGYSLIFFSILKWILSLVTGTIQKAIGTILTIATIIFVLWVLKGLGINVVEMAKSILR